MRKKKKKVEPKKYNFFATCSACGLEITADTLDMMDSRRPRCNTLLIINDRKRLLSRTKKELEAM